MAKASFQTPDMLSDTLPALIAQEMKQWRARLADLERNVALEMAEITSLKAKIAAGETILGRPGAAGVEGDENSLADDIKNVMQDGVARTPKMMRRDLIRHGIAPDRVSSRKGNFYNTIFRLASKERLVKQPGGKYVWRASKEAE